MTAMTICGRHASPDGRRTDSGRTECGRADGGMAEGGSTDGGSSTGSSQSAHSDNYAASDAPQTAAAAGTAEAAAHSLPAPRSGLLSRIAAAHWTTWTNWTTLWTSWFGLPGWIGGAQLVQFVNGSASFPGFPKPGLSLAQPFTDFSAFSGASDVSDLTDVSDSSHFSAISHFSDDADVPLPEPLIHPSRPHTPTPTPAPSAVFLPTSPATVLPAAATSAISGAPTASVALLLLPTATSHHPSLVGRLITALARILLTMHGWDKTTKLLAGSAIGLIPWIVILGLTLPSHTVARNWSTVWIGFDVLLAVAFGVTARLYLRNDPRVGIMAAVVATLLVVDCWFDTSTAADGLDLIESWASAIFVEIPIAIFCTRLAWRSSLAMVRIPQPTPVEPSE